jgi:vitellogenic carboxypeptidase-like protein
MCNNLVADYLTKDAMESVAGVIPDLLDQYPSLFYQGQFDLKDGVIANEVVLRNLNWTGIPEYLEAPRYVWKVDGAVGGMTRSYKNLYQCTVYGAGHMVPHDQGAASLEMLKRFIYNLSWEN